MADDWQAARSGVYPALLPVGTMGDVADRPRDWASEGIQAHAQPLITEGPCSLVVAFTWQAAGFDVLVNAEHLHGWAVSADELAGAAGSNLAAWSGHAPWTDETSGARRLLSSETGDGHDAARILLPDVRAHLTSELSAGLSKGTRVLVGLPDRDLLVAGALVPGDSDFAELLRDFVIEHSAAADQPIDRRLFELNGGQLIEFAG